MHQIRLVEQNVRRHQRRIREQARVDVIGVLLRLVLELGHALQFAHVGEAVENPGKLRMAAHVALAVDDVLFGVQAAGDVDGCQLQTAAAQSRGVLTDGDGVHVHHAVDALVFVLQKLEVAQGANVVAQRQRAGGLNAGKNDFFGFGGRIHGVFLLLRCYRVSVSTMPTIMSRLPIRRRGVIFSLRNHQLSSIT